MSSYDNAVKFLGFVPLCACGCGGVVNFHNGSFKKYIHNHHSTESNNRRWLRPGEKKRMSEAFKKMTEASLALRRTDEYRNACREGQNRRWSDVEERKAASKRMSGSGNPRWRKDRTFASVKDEWIRAVRGALKKAKHLIFSHIDMEIPELGYTSFQLKEHLEKQFLDGMSWDNWGKEWHIDHRMPVSRWPLGSDPSEVNALSNLQPLWKFDNLSKGAST